MNLTLNYNRNQQNVIIRAHGKVTISDIKSCLFHFLNSAEFSQDANTIWDVRELSFEHIDMAFLKQLVAIRKEYNAVRGNAKIAIVSDYMLAAPIIKLYMILSSGLKQQNKVFLSQEDAQLWLGGAMSSSSHSVGKLN